MIATTNKLTKMQLELLKSFSYLSDEEILEVKSLLNFYFKKKLEAAVIDEESKRNYTSSVYEDWLKSSNEL
jgi:hypothetical protein